MVIKTLARMIMKLNYIPMYTHLYELNPDDSFTKLPRRFFWPGWWGVLILAKLNWLDHLDWEEVQDHGNEDQDDQEMQEAGLQDLPVSDQSHDQS